MNKLRLLALSSLIVIGNQTIADEDHRNDFTIEGFISLGYMSASDNNFLGDTNGDDAFLTENVLKANYSFGHGFSTSGQLLYREAGDKYDGGARIDFLQLDYHTHLFDDDSTNFTLGRFKTRQGLYNETRDIPYTRPSILLPQSVYLDNTRNFLLTTDGIKVRSSLPLEESDLTFEVGYGKNSPDDKFSEVTIAETAEGDWDSENNHYVDLRWESRNLTLGYNFANVVVNYTPNLGSFLTVDFMGFPIPVPMTPGQFETDFHTYSVQYREADWELTAELSLREFVTAGFTGGARGVTDVDGGYVQFRYFVNDTWTTLIRYDDVELDFLISGQGAGVPDDLKKSTDLTLGLSWTINEDWQLMLEHHFIEGGAWLPPLTKTQLLPPLEPDWGLTAIQVSMKF
ncbi:MAG: hypothetical protein HKP09_03325 [Enterobacterales bacterium]|nr:hypothetical protein [Enterobacterales bacterium]